MFQLCPNWNSLGTLWFTKSALNAVGCLCCITQQALVPDFSSWIMEHMVIIEQGEISGYIDPFRTGHAVTTCSAIYQL